MYRKFFGLLVAAFLIAGFSNSARASILAANLTLDGNLDVISDNSVGFYSGDLGTPQIGDILQGLVRLENFNGTPTQGGTAWAIYSKVVTAVSNGNITFDAIAASSNDSIGKLLENSMGYTLPTLAAGSADDISMAIVTSSTTASLPAFNSSGFQATLNGAINSSDWNVEMLTGIVAGSDFHEVNNLTGSLLAFSGAYTIQYKSFGGGIKTVTSAQKRISTNATYSGDVVVYLGATISIPDGGTTSNPTGWDFTDAADYALNITPTPEPSTIAIWAAIGLGGCGLVARRRIKAKKA